MGFKSKKKIAVFGGYFSPWIRFQEAKILRIQRIRILSTAIIVNKINIDVIIYIYLIFIFMVYYRFLVAYSSPVLGPKMSILDLTYLSLFIHIVRPSIRFFGPSLSINFVHDHYFSANKYIFRVRLG